MTARVGTGATRQLTILLERLRRNHVPRPREIELVLERPAEVRSKLTNLLSECAAWDRLPDPAPDWPLHAIFLLAALDAFEAWHLVEAILRKPFESFVDPLLDENLLETLPWAMGRIAIDRPNVLARLVEDASVTRWVRASALDALVVQARIRPDRRAAVVETLRGWLATAVDHRLPGMGEFLVFAAEDLSCVDEIDQEIRALFAKKRIEPSVTSEEEVFRGPYYRPCNPCWDIFDLYEHYGEMIGYRDPRRVAARPESSIREEMMWAPSTS